MTDERRDETQNRDWNLNMQIGHMAAPSTWTITQNAEGSMLAGWWEVKNDVDGIVAYFRQKGEAETYKDLGENNETLGDLSPPDSDEY